MGHAVSLGQPGALAYEVCYAAFVVLVRHQVDDAKEEEGHPLRSGGERAAETKAAQAEGPGGVVGGPSRVVAPISGKGEDIWQQMAAAAKAAVSAAATQAASAGGRRADGPALGASESAPPDTLEAATGEAVAAATEAARDPCPALDPQSGIAGLRQATASEQVLNAPAVACSGSLEREVGTTVQIDAEPPNLSGAIPGADEGLSEVTATNGEDGAVSQPAPQDPSCIVSSARDGKAVSAGLAGPVLGPDDSNGKFTTSTAAPWQRSSDALREDALREAAAPLTRPCPSWSSWLLLHGQAECAEHGVAWMIMED